MKLFISSRLPDSLGQEYVALMYDHGHELYTDLETLESNMTMFEELIYNHTCGTCNGSGLVDVSVEDITYTQTCPDCHGKGVHFKINLITPQDPQDIVLDDIIMDNITIFSTNGEVLTDELIIKLCEGMYINSGENEYNIDTSDMKLILGYKDKKKDMIKNG